MQKIRLTALKLTYLPNEALKWNMGARLHTKRAKSEKSEETNLHVGQKRPFTPKIRSLVQELAILDFKSFQMR